MFEKQELEAEKRKLEAEKKAFHDEKKRFADMMKQPAEQRPTEYLTPAEVADQLNRQNLKDLRIKYEMWSWAIKLDQCRHYGREYTV